MNRFYLLTLILFSIIGTSCVQESARSSSAIINQVAGSGRGIPNDPNDNGLCSEFWDVSGEEQACVSECGALSQLATQDEIDDVIFLVNRDFSPADAEVIIANINNAQGVCIASNPRPTDQIEIDSNFCACKDGKSDLINNCQSICNGKPNTTTSVLYGSATPTGADVLFNPELGNLENWCTAPLVGSETPGCALELISGNDTVTIDVSVSGNNFQANLTDVDVPYGRTFIARIIESQSDSNAVTSTFQIRRYQDTGDSDETLFKVMPISQYNCISVAGTLEQGTGDFNYDRYIKTHYYFASSSTPPAIPDTVVPPILCHDINENGTKDSALFPRLGLRPIHFALWNVSDIRFVDLDNNGFPDINDTIEASLATTGDNVVGRQIFNLLQWPNMPGISGLTPSGNPNLGIFMQPWLDENNNGYCPDEDDLTTGDNNVFRELGKYVGDTEAIYIAESEFVQNPDGSNITDVMIMRQTDLEKIWFYFEKGQHLFPDTFTVNNKTIHYYWPIDFDNPHTRKSDSLLYTVKFPSNIGQSGASSGLPNTINPPDKRFGCVPKYAD